MHTATGFPALLRAFRPALTPEGLRPCTAKDYAGDVGRFAACIEGRSPPSITPADIRDYFAGFQDGRSPKTVREAQLTLAGRVVVLVSSVRQDTRDTRVDPGWSMLWLNS